MCIHQRKQGMRLFLVALFLRLLWVRRHRTTARFTCTHASVENSSSRDRQGFAALVGNTKLVRLKSLSAQTGCDILVKAEYENPGGTSKDRVARQIVEDAEDAGVLGPGGTIVEGSSGSTGISLALMAACRGYACTIFMPDDQAVEKSNLLVTLGASVERVKPVSIVHPKHYVNLARKYAESTPGAFFANQFENGSNWRAHYASTGPEIWRQTQGKIDAFVMGAGTGGTLAGVSKYLKEQASRIKVVLVDPPGSSLYNRVKHGVCYAEEQAESRVRRHRYDTIIEGVGLDRITANFNEALVDDAVKCSDEEAVAMSRQLLKQEGIFVGSSSAMHCVGAVKVAQMLGPGHTIVTLLCDSGQRHMSRLWNPEFLASRGLSVPP